MKTDMIQANETTVENRDTSHRCGMTDRCEIVVDCREDGNGKINAVQKNEMNRIRFIHSEKRSVSMNASARKKNYIRFIFTLIHINANNAKSIVCTQN